MSGESQLEQRARELAPRRFGKSFDELTDIQKLHVLLDADEELKS